MAIVRVEQLYPLPIRKINNAIDKYSNAEKFVWAQEEPSNMGAWMYMLYRFPKKLTLASPSESAAPAPGSFKTAMARHRKAIETAFEI